MALSEEYASLLPHDKHKEFSKVRCWPHFGQVKSRMRRVRSGSKLTQKGNVASERRQRKGGKHGRPAGRSCPTAIDAESGRSSRSAYRNPCGAAYQTVARPAAIVISATGSTEGSVTGLCGLAASQTDGPWARRSSTSRIAARSLPSHSSACSPTRRTDHANASDRERATPASTRVSST